MSLVLEECILHAQWMTYTTSRLPFVSDCLQGTSVCLCCCPGQVPEGCETNPFQKIAVTILACFCTDPELVRYLSALPLPLPPFQSFLSFLLLTPPFPLLPLLSSLPPLSFLSSPPSLSSLPPSTQVIHPQVTSKIPLFNNLILHR